MSKSKKVKKLFDESAGMYNPGSMGLVKVGKYIFDDMI
jgi:hypothetical protein